MYEIASPVQSLGIGLAEGGGVAGWGGGLSVGHCTQEFDVARKAQRCFEEPSPGCIQ